MFPWRIYFPLASLNYLMNLFPRRSCFLLALLRSVYLRGRRPSLENRCTRFGNCMKSVGQKLVEINDLGDLEVIFSMFVGLWRVPAAQRSSVGQKGSPPEGGVQDFRKTQSPIWSPLGCQPVAEKRKQIEKACYRTVPGGDLTKTKHSRSICGHDDPQK